MCFDSVASLVLVFVLALGFVGFNGAASKLAEIVKTGWRFRLRRKTPRRALLGEELARGHRPVLPPSLTHLN